MYTDLKSYQIVLALLKEYGIRRCVLSAGTRNVPFVHSVEEDPYFDCYSVVDERSAGYFALGLSQQVHEPVVISCTSSTACCNYYPPVAEAFYQRVPLVILTSDRDPARLHQWEEQMIDQVNMFQRHTVKSVNLPVVTNRDEEIWCQRLVNEALSELSHNGGGPVHINIPTMNYNKSFSTRELPKVIKTERLSLETEEEKWNLYVEKLRAAKRILVTPGQSSFVSADLRSSLEAFFQRYNAAVAVDYMANIDADFAINTSLCFDIRNISAQKFAEFLPDIVISFGGNIFQGLKEMLVRSAGSFEHWLIQPDGAIVDTYKSITTVFECSPEHFFSRFADAAKGEGRNDMGYYRAIKSYADSMEPLDVDYCNVYAIKNLVESIPSNAILHLAINGAIRIANYSKLNPHVQVYANIGTFGIDGCMSSFLGQACVSKVPSFLVIGDLAFFYDMNALRIRHVTNNVRILLINNGGGEEFYYNKNWMAPTGDLHTSARHHTKAEGWVREAGFRYLSATDAKSFDAALKEFLKPDAEKPVLLEVFTEMSTDAKALHAYHQRQRNLSGSDRPQKSGKELVKSIIGQKGVNKIKGMLGK